MLEEQAGAYPDADQATSSPQLDDVDELLDWVGGLTAP